jgi:hypothetical protein
MWAALLRRRNRNAAGNLGDLSVAATTWKGSVHQPRDLVLHVTVPPGTGKCIYIEIICQLAQPLAISSLFHLNEIRRAVFTTAAV